MDTLRPPARKLTGRRTRLASEIGMHKARWQSGLEPLSDLRIGRAPINTGVRLLGCYDRRIHPRPSRMRRMEDEKIGSNLCMSDLALEVRYPIQKGPLIEPTVALRHENSPRQASLSQLKLFDFRSSSSVCGVLFILETLPSRC